MSKELKHDRHSVFTNQMVFSPKYSGKILIGKVALVAGWILCLWRQSSICK
jgi:hypothetical protein